MIKAYKAFTTKDWPSATAPGLPSGPAGLPGSRRVNGVGRVGGVGGVGGAAKPDSNADLAFIAGLADANISILIRALLDAQTGSGDWAGAEPALDAGEDGLSAGPAAFALARERLEVAREDAASKFLEFRERWRKRLAFAQLHPFLQRNQWLAEYPEGFALAGKGTRKDAKMLYLQSLHDMASDGERQVSFIAGAVFRHEGDVAAAWHKESVKGNRSRLLPALEASLRSGESALFKRLRLSLGDLAQEAFTENVNKWDKRFFHTEEELFNHIAWPWYKGGRASGFEGFMEAFADLCEALCAAMLEHYEGKWDLYLRGLSLHAGG